LADCREIYPKIKCPPELQPGDKVITHPIVVLGTESTKRVLFEFREAIQEGELTKFRPLGANWIASGDLNNAKEQKAVA
jgi:hypothetical protein